MHKELQEISTEIVQAHELRRKLALAEFPIKGYCFV